MFSTYTASEHLPPKGQKVGEGKISRLPLFQFFDPPSKKNKPLLAKLVKNGICQKGRAHENWGKNWGNIETKKIDPWPFSLFFTRGGVTNCRPEGGNIKWG